MQITATAFRSGGLKALWATCGSRSHVWVGPDAAEGARVDFDVTRSTDGTERGRHATVMSAVRRSRAKMATMSNGAAFERRWVLGVK